MVAPWIEPASLECEASDDAKADAVAIASEVLFHLTGRRWPGVVRDELVRRDGGCQRCSSWWMWLPGPAPWRPYSADYCQPPGWRLPGYPVLRVVSVAVDGDVLDPAEYRLEDRRRLVRLDGAWPTGGAMAVVYEWGGGPGPAGEAAARAYACELAKSMTPSCKDCRLPRRVTTVTRQGVSVAMVDPMNLSERGLVGLAEVDGWITAVRLGDARRRGTVVMPGRRTGVRFAP